MKFTIEEMLAKLPMPANAKWPDGVWDNEPHTKGNVRLVFFAPRGKDRQISHEEDEYYFVARGTGDLVIEDRVHPFAAGDSFFVQAGVDHHFENFTDDFATWAIFF